MMYSMDILYCSATYRSLTDSGSGLREHYEKYARKIHTSNKPHMPFTCQKAPNERKGYSALRNRLTAWPMKPLKQLAKIIGEMRETVSEKLESM